MFTGQILAAGLFYLIWNFLYVVAVFLVTGLVDLFEYGVSSSSLYNYVTPAVPLGWFQSRLIFSRYPDEQQYVLNSPGTVVYALLGGLVFAVLAYVIYQKRRLERAGDFLSMNWTRPVFRWGTAIVGGIAGALCLTLMTGESTSRNAMAAKFVIFLILCALVLFFVAEMFVEKSFRVFKRKIAVEAVSCVALLLVGSAMLQFDVFGIESYVPEPEEIMQATMDLSGSYVFTEQDELEAVTDVHQYIVDQIPELKKGYDESSVYCQYVSISYVLKSGKFVTRRYFVPETDQDIVDELAQKLTACEQFPEAAKRACFGADYEDLDWQVLGAELLCYREEGEQSYTVYGSEEGMQELYTAVLADIDAGAFWSTEDTEQGSFINAELELSLGTDRPNEQVMEAMGNAAYGYITGSDSNGTTAMVTISIDEHFTHTIETLVKLGTIGSADELTYE
jgi:ABC-2 type transport system permease protein